MYKSIIPHSPPKQAPYRLQEKIVPLSVADTWCDAKREWALSDVYFEPGGSCLCGHRITEHCTITNQLNGNQVVVGNCCVRRFLQLPSERLFAALRRISANLGAALNTEMIDHAYREGWINRWETEFCRNTRQRRKLTNRQLATRRRINQKVLARCLREGGSDAR
jgi:hypothetical protein